MWLAAEDPEPVEGQESDIFRGAVLRRCDEREEGLDVVGGEFGDVVLGRWRRTTCLIEGSWLRRMPNWFVDVMACSSAF